jgi:uncharacterized membrane protein (DUF106 family)
MAIEVFGRVGNAIDTILNWFINLNGTWQFIIFVIILAIIFGIWYMVSRRGHYS